MGENRSKWGAGMSDYTEEDILSGNELYEFCANTVAQYMQDNEGYTIEGLILDSNNDNKIVEISINDPSFFNFATYYAYDW